MKKSLLFMLGLAPAMAFAQNINSQVQVSSSAPQVLPVAPKVLTDQNLSIHSSNPAYYAAKKGNNTAAAFTEVGQTFYDLQTNGSIGRRIVLHSDGTVSVTWTTAPDAAANFPQRGSGYNYFNLTGWALNSPNNARIDNFRAGWPSIGTLPNGSEFIIAHDASNGGFRISKNSAKGESDWTTGPAILQWPDNQRPIWNRTMANGNTLHVLANYSDSSSANDPRVLTREGVRGPMTYSRSLDGGVTWDKANVLLPGYDSTVVTSGGGDNYAIDVKGNTVAIVCGGLADHVLLFKSTDNGENFTRIFADSFPYAPMTNSKLILDTAACNDGALDVIIDNNGQVHVFWGVSRILNDDTLDVDGGWSFFPATSGLAHWSEATGTSQIIAGVVDERDPGVLNIEPGTWFTRTANQTLPTGLNNVARTGNTSLATMPSVGMDAQGRLFVVYSAPREFDLSIDQVNYRDVYITYSTDNGVTWGAPQNLSQAQNAEDAFASVARVVDDYVHIVWQQDDIPGTNLQNNTSSQNHPVVTNTILYGAFPVSEIINDQIGQGQGVGFGDSPEAKVFEVNQNYPNPFANETNVMVYMSQPGDLSLTVTNLMGQQIMKLNLGNYTVGNHTITIDGSELAAGMYNYTLSTGANSITNQMIVR